MRGNHTYRGETHHSAKLDPDKVRWIRKRYAVGDITLRALGAIMKISEVAIWKIIRRKTWADVE